MLHFISKSLPLRGRLEGVLLFLLFVCSSLRAADKVVIEVTNDERRQRQQLCEVPLAEVMKRLRLNDGETFVVRNAIDQEVPYQKTHDGKLLIDASVRPCGAATFTVVKGEPKAFTPYVFGKQYPERIDDYAWENDKAMWRLYGPALQARKERTYGVDIWVKNTPELCLEKRYALAFTGQPRINELQKQGRWDEANALEPFTSFHFDHGNGLDCYSVGATLGGGVPAIIIDGKMILPYCYKTYKVLDEGPLRHTVEFTYCPTDMGKNKGVVEHRVISLDKGSNYTAMTVWYEGLATGADLAAGFVIHTDDTESVILGRDYAIYADPTDNPAKQNSQIFVGVIFPNEVKSVETRPITDVRGAAAHALGIRPIADNERFTYYFGSSWSKYDVHNLEEWKLRSTDALYDLQHPMTARLK